MSLPRLVIVLCFLLGSAHAQYILAGIPLYNNVTDEARLDLDVQGVLAALRATPVNFAEARDIFTNGRYALPQTLSQPPASSFALYNQYSTYFGRADYAAAYVLSALDKTGEMQGLGDEMRVAAVATGLSTLITNMKAVESLELALTACRGGELVVNSTGVRQVDLAWGYYAGSLEGQSIMGNAAGVLGFRSAATQCSALATCTVAGVSPVNSNVAVAMSRATLQAQREAAPCVNTRAAVDQVIVQLRVPAVQALVKLIYDIPTQSGEALRASHAQAWTLVKSLAPVLATCDARVLNTLTSKLDITLAAPMVSITADNLVWLLQSAYACLGVTCAEVGAPVGKTACSDATATSEFSYNLKEYRFRRNVLSLAKFDGDLVAMQQHLTAGDFAAAENTYSVGGSWVDADTGLVRSLASLASGAQYAGEPVFSTYAALAFRKQAAMRGAVQVVLWHQVQHKLLVALQTCKSTSGGDAVVAVDEAWALHTGITGDYSLFAGNVDECTQTSTCVSGRSPVNDRLVALFTAAQTAAALRDCTTLELSLPTIRQQMTIPNVQNLLRNMDAAKPPNADPAVPWASAWASAYALLPALSACDEEAANVLRDNLDPTRTFVAMQLGSSKDLPHYIVSAYDCLQLTCTQVGQVGADMEVLCPVGSTAGLVFVELSAGAQAGIAIACILFWALSLVVIFRLAKRHGIQSKVQAARHMGTDTSLVSRRSGRQNSFLN
ncbi:hypothetical protein BASA81_013284 [Batrachochytrium salamandrivorans]|nr:hypothetical protein BASA81_013284 [Batrachochytrium salamandrivorans]